MMTSSNGNIFRITGKCFHLMTSSWYVVQTTPMHYLSLHWNNYVSAFSAYQAWHTVVDKLLGEKHHYSDVIMSAMAYQIGASIVCSVVCSGADQRKHQIEGIKPHRLESLFHYTWCRRQMGTFSALLSLCAGNPPVTDGLPSQRESNADLWCFPVDGLNKLLNKLNSWPVTPCPTTVIWRRRK